MKLSLDILFRELQEAGFRLHCSSSAEKIRAATKFNRCALFRSAPFFEQGFLYIADDASPLSPDQLAQCASAGGCLLYLTGEEKLPDNTDCPIVSVFSDQASEEELYRCISKALSAYSDWYEQLYEAIPSHNIQRILDLTQPLFRRPLFFFVDNLVRVVAHSYPKGTARGSFPVDINSPYESYHTMQERFNDPFSKESMTFHGVFSFPDIDTGREMLCYNIFSDSRFSARVYTDDIKGSYTPSDHRLMEILGQMIQLAYQEPKESVYNENSDTIRLMQSLLEGRPASQIMLQYTLSNLGWLQGFFRVIYLRVNDPNSTLDRNCGYLCRIFVDRFEDVLPLTREGDIVLVCHTSEPDNYPDFFPSLLELAENSQLKFGMSNAGANTDQLHALYIQARAASAVLAEEVSYRAYCTFDSIAMNYLLKHGTAGFAPETICAPELLRLVRYDEEHNSGYVETLLTYLLSGFNAVATAEKLFVHHATMVYRLKRIKEISRINFEDIQRMMYILASYTILNLNQTPGD